MKVLFLIRSLNAGGAERQLIELVKNLDKSKIKPVIVTFYDGGTLRNELEKTDDISLYSLGKGGRWDLLGFFFRLMDIIGRENPDVIHGYLDVPNLFSLVTGRLKGKKVVWGLRASNIDFKQYDWTAGFIYGLAARLSSLADGIIVNSKAGWDYHVLQGFSPRRMVVIFNGFDTNLLFPDKLAGLQAREKWGIRQDVFLIGQAGRIDPMKAPENFIKAAARISQTHPSVKFVYVGAGEPAYQKKLETMGMNLGLSEKLFWVGSSNEMRSVYNALDILVLSSTGEGFPNVVGEAMACGIPCVVTDVGDAAQVVGETGVIVKAGNVDALEQGLEKVINYKMDARLELGVKARERIVSLFSIQTLTEKTQEILLALPAGKMRDISL